MRIKDEIIYDANFSINRFRGMGRFINNFVRILENERNIKAKGLLKGNLIIEKNDHYKSFGFSNYILWEQFSLPLALKDYQGIKIFPYNTAPLFLKRSSKNVLILHDLIFMDKVRTNSWKQKLGARYRQLIVPLVIKKFDNLITVSEYSKRQIVERFKIDSNKVAVIYNSVEEFEGLSSRVDIEKEKIIFHIGGEPHYKNSKILLYAFSKLKNQIAKSFRLKLVGIRDPNALLSFKKLAEELGIISNVDFLPYQSNDEIKGLYQRATVFVFPSLEEGFGIPIIESFNFGCPLICSDASCLPEIAGDAAVYFDPKDSDSLTKAIERVIENRDNFVDNNIVRGFERVKDFSHEKFRTQVLDWFDDYIKNQ